MCDDLDNDKREQVKESDNIRKKQMRGNLDDNKIGKLKNVHNRKKNVTTLIHMKRKRGIEKFR